MSLSPLLNASPVIQIHAFAALAALALGIVQMAAPKGTFPHRVMGYVWAALMLTIAGSSLWIKRPGWWMGFGPIHVLSAYVLVAVPIAVMRARQGRIGSHSKTMIGLFLGALIVAGLFTFVPGRIMHAVLFGA
jgi:uncharacterized membrane protein